MCNAKRNSSFYCRNEFPFVNMKKTNHKKTDKNEDEKCPKNDNCTERNEREQSALSHSSTRVEIGDMKAIKCLTHGFDVAQRAHEIKLSTVFTLSFLHIRFLSLFLCLKRDTCTYGVWTLLPGCAQKWTMYCVRIDVAMVHVAIHLIIPL